MQRLFIFAIFTIFLTLSCAQRPKMHHPQPEFSASEQVLRVFFASVDAYLKQDMQRLSAYVAPRWGKLDKGQTKNSYNNKDFHTLVYGKFFTNDDQAKTLKWLAESQSEIKIAGKYQVNQANSTDSFQLINYSEHIKSDDCILLIPSLDNLNEPKLLLIISRMDNIWKIVAAEIL